MKTRLFSVCVGAALAMVAASASAGKDIETGRITVKFQEANWKGSAEMPYRLELRSAQGTFGGKAKVLSLAGPDGTPQAVMYLGATYGKTNVYSGRGQCRELPDVYVHDLNDSKLENYRCAYAGGPYKTDSLLEGLLPYLKDAQGTVEVAAPDASYFVLIRVTARGGFVIQIEALMAPGFVGLTGAKPKAEVPAELPPEVAAWADRLAENAIKALTSFSGNLDVPPVVFSDAAK
jgi:hypothetical protein